MLAEITTASSQRPRPMAKAANTDTFDLYALHSALNRVAALQNEPVRKNKASSDDRSGTATEIVLSTFRRSIPLPHVSGINEPSISSNWVATTDHNTLKQIEGLSEIWIDVFDPDFEEDEPYQLTVTAINREDLNVAAQIIFAPDGKSCHLQLLYTTAECRVFSGIDHRNQICLDRAKPGVLERFLSAIENFNPQESPDTFLPDEIVSIKQWVMRDVPGLSKALTDAAVEAVGPAWKILRSEV